MITRLVSTVLRQGVPSIGIVMVVVLLGVDAGAAESALSLTLDQVRGGDIATQPLIAGDPAGSGRITLTGRVEMPEHGPDPVLAPASAMVVAVYAHPGDTVARGAPIVAVAGSGAVAGDYDKAGADGRRGSRVRPGSGIRSIGWKQRLSIGSTLRCGVLVRGFGAGWS